MTLIRQALGSIREPITQEALGALVGFDKYKVSRIERGAQELSRSDALAIAAADPLRRGAAWLMFGDEGQGDVPGVPNDSPRPRNAPRIAPSVPPRGVIVDAPARRPTRKRRPGDRTALAG